MLVVAILPVIVCILGLLLWAYKSKPASIAIELGKIMFAVGLLVTLFVLAHYTVRLF
jgi:hypothetical protein